MKVFSLVDYYIPGYKFGGPGRALANLVDALGDDINFEIVTADRDFEENHPYQNVTVEEWQTVGKADVYYLERSRITLRKIRDLILDKQPDIIYLNSFLSPKLTVKPLILRRLGVIPRLPVIVAPRGEHASSALAIDAGKKRVFIAAAKAMGLYCDVIWQALSPQEEREIRNCFGNEAKIQIARDMISFETKTGFTNQHKKEAGELKLVFLSRISKLKIMHYALIVFINSCCDIEFNIYGPIVDRDVWIECEALIAEMPPNIRVNYKGSLDHCKVNEVLHEHDLFILPTFSEGSATAVLEAFVSGCLVLISNNTPYHNLEAEHVGWDIPLEQPHLFCKALQQCADMGQDIYSEWSTKASEYGMRLTDTKILGEESRLMFQSALEEARKTNDF